MQLFEGDLRLLPHLRPLSPGLAGPYGSRPSRRRLSSRRAISRSSLHEGGAEGVPTEGAMLAFHATLPVFPFVLAVDNRSGDGTSIEARDVPVLP